MTKTLFAVASVALVAFVAGCSADTTEEGSSTTTTDNGTLPAEQPATAVTHKPVAKNTAAAAKDLAGSRDRSEGLRDVQGVDIAEEQLRAPELRLQPDPINQ